MGLCSGYGNSVVIRELSLYPQSLLAKLTVHVYSTLVSRKIPVLKFLRLPDLHNNVTYSQVIQVCVMMQQWSSACLHVCVASELLASFPHERSLSVSILTKEETLRR